MPGLIKILPQQLADKIAAGEVVGRPASVVKELVENSIDAHARSITVVIKEGGKTLIQVIDDGSGISPDDAKLAFARHATSKISTYDDLENIRTLGFRGEALASIAAVSQVEMRTRVHSSETGIKIRNEGGSISAAKADAPSAGTSITVRNLFFNTPGRRNFLKSTATEYKYIADVVTRFALSHPEIQLKFVSNDETILSLDAAELQARARDIFGEKFSATLLFFEDSDDYAGIRGFLGKPDFLRKTRAEQYVFLNGRSIVNRNINHAVSQGYEQMIEKGSFPVFAVYLTIDPKKVDVNVHPSKMDVKFGDESGMHRFVFTSVRKALSSHDLIQAARVSPAGEGNVSFRSEPARDAVRPASFEEMFSPPPAGEARAESPREDRAATPIWQAHNKYIILPVEEGLMIVDQHAAHERVLYERAVAGMNGGEHRSQQLLFPHSVEMTVPDALLVSELLPLLESMGFVLKIFGKTTVIVDGVPTDVKPGDESTILQQVIDLYKEDDKNIRLEPRERLAKSYSCKAAVKSGDALKDGEMRALLDRLFATAIPYVCPHGRPILIRLPLTELDRRFGRTPG